MPFVYTTPVETKFSIAWDFQIPYYMTSFIYTTKSSTFSFQNVLYYFELAYKPCRNCELVLHRADNTGSLETTFDVALLLEKDRRTVSGILSYTEIKSLPSLLFSIHVPDILQFCTGLPDSKIVSPWGYYETKFVFFFHFDPSSETKCNEGTNLSTQMTNSNFSSHLESMSEDFSNLLKNEVLPDVKLRCGDLIVPAHRSVLAARSEVFAAMFRNEMSESRTGAVNVEDLNEGVFDLLLKYLYSGKIADVPDNVVPGLYAAADKYAVKALKTWCRERMVRSLTEQNCVSVLTVADGHSDADFKKAVISFICSHDSVFKSDAWLSFSKVPSKLVVEVLQSFAESKINKS